MVFAWLRDGTLQGRSRRGGGTGDRKAQWQKATEKRRLEGMAAAAAAGRPFKLGRPHGSQKKRLKGAQSGRAQTMTKRRLRGKQTPMRMIRFA